MRKSLSYRQGQALIRIWTRRLILGAAGSYAIGLGVLVLFRRMGGDAMMTVGFLCVFAVIPMLVLILFSLPSRYGRSKRGPARADRTTLLLVLPILISLIALGAA